jgi:hypothetical protein
MSPFHTQIWRADSDSSPNRDMMSFPINFLDSVAGFNVSLLAAVNTTLVQTNKHTNKLFDF